MVKYYIGKRMYVLVDREVSILRPHTKITLTNLWYSRKVEIMQQRVEIEGGDASAAKKKRLGLEECDVDGYGLERLGMDLYKVRVTHFLYII